MISRPSPGGPTGVLSRHVLLTLLGVFVFSPSALFSRQQSSTAGQSYVNFPLRLLADPRAPLQTEQQWLGLSLYGYSGRLKIRKPRGMVQTVELDKTGQYIIAEERYFKVPVRVPTILTRSDYYSIAGATRMQDDWRKAVVDGMLGGGANRKRGPGGLNIDIPVPIKSKTFQKIFGGDKVGLNVQGDIRINGGFRNENRSEVRTTIAQGSNTNFKMNQTQRFTVTGKIGEKVTVNVDQDSERAFDFDNNIKLHYKGFDDEIIKSIEAGNISLSLPATRFVTFSGKSTGLFGIKAQMQLGNLHITAIASQEKGESQQLSVKGGAAGNKTKINDYNYRRYTYFFLDSTYRENWHNYAEEWTHIAAEYKITNINVYKSQRGYEQKTEAIRGWALPDPSVKSDTTKSSKEYHQGHFLLLEPGSDYTLYDDLGYIVMAQPMQKDEVLAVTYKAVNANGDSIVVGDLNYDRSSSQPIFLKIIKAENPLPTFRYTWDLEWKNVYYLGSRNIPQEEFKVRILYQPPSGNLQEDQETEEGVKSFLEILGLDVRDINGDINSDGVIDLDPNIVDLARGEIIFPNLRPFDPLPYTVNGVRRESELKDEFRESDFYDESEAKYRTKISNFRFTIEVESQNRSATFALGFNVIEGSERVVLDGQVLERGRDYTIEYLSGSLTLLNERATLPNANLEITYEKNQFFKLDKKNILGTRAEYRFGERSFLGATLLYLNETTIDQKVRVGRGPMRNLIWDLNGAFDFKPEFLTRGLDALPLIRASQPSSVKFEGEIAQVIPNPNTLNNAATDDRDGVAYVDDFENSKRPSPLGVQRKNWTLASAPEQYIGADKQRSMAQMGKLIWYNPYGGILIKDVFPNREVNAQTGQTMEAMFLEFEPRPYEDRPVFESWGGIQRALPTGSFDQTESKFLEIIVNGDKGILHINLGQISEDVIPNNKLDSEDIPVAGIRLGILDPGEDVGLDGMSNEEAAALGADQDWWDINEDGVRQPWEPYSDDDWAYTPGSTDFRFINGTENSANDGTRIPDTEDINRNGSVDLTNSYFEYTIDLSSTKYQAGPATPKGWKLYRIPLVMPPEGSSDPTRRKVRNPDLSQIEFARIWVNGVDEKVLIGIAEINLVGNEWKELGIYSLDDPQQFDSENDSTVAVTVVNTHENLDYTPPPGVEGAYDQINRIRSKEQALVLDVNDLPSGMMGLARKSFFETQNFIYYEKLKMYVYARDEYGTHITSDTSDIEFFIRFGSDPNNYYEVRERVYPGWDERNEIVLNFLDMTSLKLDSLLYNHEFGYFEKNVKGKIYRVKGNPSITNVRVLYAGVKNLSALNLPFSGQVWMNELRISNVEKAKGMAMRGRFDIRLSDFISMNGELNRQDADFHNVATRFGSGDNRTAVSLNSSIKLDKLLPQSWGLNIPVNVNYSESNSTPKYLPGKDIRVSEGLPDSVLQQIRTQSRQQGFSVSFSRAKASKNFLLKYTIDRLKGNFSHTASNQTSPTTLLADRKSWAGNLDYSLQFGPDTYFEVFRMFSSLPLLNRMSKMKFYYLPRSLSARIQGTTSRSISQTRTNSGAAGKRNDVYKYDVTRNFSLNYRMFDNLTANFNRSAVGDFRQKGLQGLFSNEFIDINKNQSFKLDFNPTWFSWATNNFSYSANYRYTNNLSLQERGRSAGTQSNLSASMTLKLSQIFKGGGSKTSRRRQPPGRRRRKPGQKAEGEKEKKQEKEKKKSGSANPLLLLKNLDALVGKFRDIRITYGQRSTVNNSALLEGTPHWRYQFGLASDPGLGKVAGQTGTLFTETVNRNLTASTGFQLLKRIDIQVNFTHDEQRTQNSQITGSYSDSWLQVGSLNMPFPEWTVSWNNIERLALLKKVAQKVSLSHNFTGKRSVFWNNEQNLTQREDFSISFRPLLKLSITWKNNMTSNLQINKTRSINNRFNINTEIEQPQISGGQRTSALDISFTTNYSKRGGFNLPLPFLKNKKLKNTVDVALTFSSTRNQNEQFTATEGWVPTTETSRWSFQSRVTYSFSSRVRGGASFELGKTKSTTAGETKIREFLIDVNISIRGN